MCFNYDPYDIKALFHPVDFVVFNGLNAGKGLEDITLLTRTRRGDNLQKTVAKAVKDGSYAWKYARVTEEGGVNFEQRGGIRGIAKKDHWIENRRHVKNYPHGKAVHIQRSTLKQLDRRCVVCGETDASLLVVDHINRNSLDNGFDNLQVLCRKCHLEKMPDSPYLNLLLFDAIDEQARRVENNLAIEVYQV